MYKNIILLALVSLIISCSDDGGNAPAAVVDLITVGTTIDVDNTNTPADALVSFSLSDIRLADQIAIVVIPTSAFSTIADVNIEAIPASSREVVTASRLNFKMKLSSSLQDINGGTIQNNQDYTLVFIVTSEGASQINRSTGTFRLTDQNVLIGRYSGTWNDNLYTDFGISAVLEEKGTTISGPFYYSQSFASCCGGNDDGSIRVVTEDDKITSFTYSQTLLSFNGGPCDGLYSGSGSIEQGPTGISILVNFEGNDCEGSHTGGRINLVRIE